MSSIDEIREHMEVIGADGVHVGTVDAVEGRRIKLTKADSGQGSHQGHHHYVSVGLVAEVEGDKVRLSANGAGRSNSRKKRVKARKRADGTGVHPRRHRCASHPRQPRLRGVPGGGQLVGSPASVSHVRPCRLLR